MTYRVRDVQSDALRRSRIADAIAEKLRGQGNETSYDPASGIVRATDKANRTFQYRLSATGFVDAIATPAGRTTFLKNDRAGNLLEVIEPSGRTTQFSYDARDNPAMVGRDGIPFCEFRQNPEATQNDVTFFDGSRARGVFDSNGRPLELANRVGAIDRFTYDDSGRLRELTDGCGQTTLFGYGPTGKPAQTRHPSGRVDEVSYTGPVARITVNGAPSVEVENDGSGHPVTIRYADGTTYQYAYDAAGHLLAATGPTSRSEYRYADGRLVEENNDGQVFRFEYDPTGLLSAISYPDGSRTTFGYEADKRPSTITDWSGATAFFQYDTQDRRVTIQGPNGLDTWFELGRSGRPERIVVAERPTRRPLLETLLQYDIQDRMISEADSMVGTRHYRYDAESQLILVQTGAGATLESFSYDAAGNRTSRSGEGTSVEAGNRLVRQGDIRCTYDARGNLATRFEAGQTWTFSYDLRDQLVRAQGPTGTIRFEYDALGRRVLKECETYRVQYVWCGEQLAREVVTAGEIRETRDYLYLPGTYTPYALRIDGKVYYYHNNHQGTPQRVSDSSGRIVWAAQFEAFGAAKLLVATIRNPLRSAGQYYDDETGLTYNRSRYYCAPLGRYISVDPAGLLGGHNLYVYVGNNPLNRIDPRGLWWKAALAVVAGAAVAAAVILTAPVSVPLLAVVAGAAVLGVAVGVGVDKALNINKFCVPCALSAFAEGFVSGALIGVTVMAAAIAFPEAAVAIAVGGAALGSYAILAEHLGWPLPRGDLSDPSTWRLESGPSFDQMNEDQKSASLGNLAGTTAGAVAGGAAAKGALTEAPAGQPATAQAAQQDAAAIQSENIPKDLRPPVAAAGETTDGKLYTARSYRGSGDPPLDPEVQSVMDNIPPEERAPDYQHGRCAEPQLATEMLQNGSDPHGAKVTPVMSRPKGNPKAGQYIPPCQSCQHLADHYGWDMVQPNATPATPPEPAPYTVAPPLTTGPDDRGQQ